MQSASSLKSWPTTTMQNTRNRVTTIREFQVCDISGKMLMRCIGLVFCFIANLCYLLDMSSQKFESELLLPFCGSSNEKFVMLLFERSNCMRFGISRAMPLSTSVMWLLERLRHFRFVRLVWFNLTTLVTRPSVIARDCRFDSQNRFMFSSSTVASMMCSLLRFVFCCKTADANIKIYQ